MDKILVRFVSVGFGVAAFVIAWGLGSALTVTTGIPLAGGLLNGVLTAMVLTIGLRALDRPGTGTLIWFAFSVPATMTGTLGPPGLYKIAMALAAGLLWDLIYFGLGRSIVGLYVGAIASAMSIMGLMLLLLGLGFGQNPQEALDKYRSAIYILLVINAVVTVIGVFLGDRFYSARLSKLDVFQNLRPEEDDGSIV